MHPPRLSKPAVFMASFCAIGALGLGLASRVESIDTALFMPYSAETRTIEVSAIVPAEPDAVFAQISTMDGIKRWLNIESDIELAIGGAYEWYTEPENPRGHRGTDGSQILGFAPGRMLCVAWNTPPTLHQVRGARTWVTFLVEPVRGGTRVTVVHAGFGDTPGWDKAHRYYEAGWPVVLTRLRQSMGVTAD